MEFLPIKPEEWNENTFKIIGSDWYLITAGTEQKYNMMTASWGSMGVLWGLNVCTVYIRPSRYTYRFIEENPQFSLCFFNEEYKKILGFCGANSGRDTDKIRETGLTPITLVDDWITYEESRLTICCKKIFAQNLDPDNFLEPSISSHYPQKDYHRMYVGEIKAAFKTR